MYFCYMLKMIIDACYYVGMIKYRMIQLAYLNDEFPFRVLTEIKLTFLNAQ